MTLVAVSLLLGAIVIEGEGQCPEPQLVAARAEALLSPGGRAAPDVRAELAETDTGVVLRVRREGGEWSARSLPTDWGCDERASAAALVVVMAARGQTPEPFEAPPIPEAPASRAAVAEVEAPPVAATQADVELGGWIGAASAAGLVAPGGGVEASWPPSEPWALRGALALTGRRELALGDGTVGWQRGWLSMALRRRWPAFPTVSIDGHLALLGSLLRLAARGYPINRGEWLIDPGGALGVRALVPLGPLTVWVGGDAQAWPLRHHLLVAGVDTRRMLPELEVFLAAGGFLNTGGSR